jgi:hypothetical protein
VAFASSEKRTLRVNGRIIGPRAVSPGMMGYGTHRRV